MDYVRELRRRTGVTQQLLSDLSGVSTGAISTYETGRASPTIDTLQILGAAVDIEVVVTLVPMKAQGDRPRTGPPLAPPLPEPRRRTSPDSVTSTDSVNASAAESTQVFDSP